MKLKFSLVLFISLFALMNTHAQTINFYVPAGVAYPAKLLSFQHENDRLQVRIEVTPEVWSSIDLVMLFNLTWDNRNEGSVSGEKEVELVLFFSKALYTELKANGNLLTDEDSFLKAEASHPMKRTKNWFATEVTESVDLPDSLKSMGTLREGFTTAWINEFK